ncbi:unnamed protein product [Candida verbasci]|uniref:MoaB/Mog domain-containing protein n=1 Tax=Candida verbasci TaxID=1227364 RepID=A0A9W4TZN3_9ASCO|nr:unnamed protein product [Candida verbasci]
MVQSSNQGKSIRNAGCLIIGDEILNGKILDTNSYNFAKFCFNRLSIPLSKTIVCGDDEKDITQSLDFLTKQNEIDFIITSGGLGSTHDDITYKVIADYFKVSCELDNEVVDRMKKLRAEYIKALDTQQLHAYFRMATIPVPTTNSNTLVEKFFVDEKLWFPIVALNQQVYILPGVPQLFMKLINAIEPILKPRIKSQQYIRRYVVTKTNESVLAPFLTNLQKICNEKYGLGNLKLGSYPHMGSSLVTISIIGKDLNKEDYNWIVIELINHIGGEAKEITQEEEDKLSNES